MSGVLYLVATPIGNLEDITLRAIRVLNEAELICCEDTRHSGKLLQHLGVKKPLLSFHEHNERNRQMRVLDAVRQGQKVILISDAGTPAISDPGFALVRACREEGLDVVPIPGASAAITALCASGLPTDRFVFHGFPPEAKGKRERFFVEAAPLPYTGIFYLSPHKAARQLEHMARHFGERPAVLGRELTKLHEEFTSATVEDLAAQLAEQPVKGELVLLVAGAEEETLTEADQQALVQELLQQGLHGRSLAEELSSRLGLTRKQGYRLALDAERDQEEETDDEPGMSSR